MADQLTPAERDQVLKNGKHKCASCGKDLSKGAKWEAHRKDRSKLHCVSNCVPLCASCHGDTQSYGKPKP